MKYKEPKDIINRNAALKMTDKELTKAIKRTVEKLNRRLTSLEKSGLHRVSASYDIVMNYIKSELGGKRFSSKKVQYASKQERAEFLTTLLHYESFGLTKTEVTKQLKSELQKLNEKMGGIIPLDEKITLKELITIKDAMKLWREYIGHSNIADLMTSSEARQFFIMMRESTKKQVKQVFSELAKFNTGEYKREDYPIFLDYYDASYGAPITSERGITYNPMNGVVYKNHKPTEYIYDDTTHAIKDALFGLWFVNENGSWEEIK